MASSGNNRTLVAAIRADVSAALVSARQLADGFVRVGRAVQATDVQITEAGKLLGLLRVKSEAWTKSQIEGVQKQVESLQKLRKAGAVTANEYDRAIAAAQKRIENLGRSLGQDMRTAAQRAADAMKALGVTSEASQKQAAQAVKDHVKELRKLKAAGEITAADLKAAMKAANDALGRDTRTASQKASDAMKALGVVREADVKKQIASQNETIKKLEEFRQKGQITSRDFAAGMAAAKAKIDELNKSIGKANSSQTQRAREIMGAYGITGERDVRARIAAINEEIQALGRLKAANKITQGDFERASSSMKRKIDDLNKSIGVDTRTSAQRAGDALRSFGVEGEAGIRKQIASHYEAIRALKEFKRQGEITSRDFIAGVKSAKAEIDALNRSLGAKPRSKTQQARELMGQFGVTSERDTRAQIAAIEKQIQALDKLRAANRITAEDFARTSAVMRARQDELTRSLGIDTRTAAQKAAESMKALGATSEAAQRQAVQAIKEHIKQLRTLKAAGEITAKDLAAAIKLANQAMGIDTSTAAQKATDALKAMGVTREADIRRQIAVQKESIKQLEEFRRKGQITARDLTLGMAAAKAQIDALNKSLGKDTRSQTQRARDIMGQFGTRSKSDVQAEIAGINSQIQALARLRAANKITAEDFIRAQTAMKKKIDELNKSIGVDTRTSAEKARQTLEQFGVAGDKAVKKIIAGLKEQFKELVRARAANEITDREFIAGKKKVKAEIDRLNQSIGKDTRTAAQKALEAWTSFGVRRKKQIEDEIASVRKLKDAALAAANLTASEKFRIEAAHAARVKKLNQELAASTASAFQQRMQAAASAMSGAAPGVTGVGMAASIGLGAPSALVGRDAISRTVDFDRGWRAAQARMMTAPDDMQARLREEVVELGTNTIYSPGQVAKALEAMLGAGVDPKTLLDGGLKAATDFAAAIDLDLIEAARTLAIGSKQFETSLTDAADIMTGFLNSSTFVAEDLRFNLAMGGGVAGMAGIKLEDYAAAQAMTSQLFGSGSDAGTSFKTFFLRLVSPETQDIRDAHGLDFFNRAPEVMAVQKASQASIAHAQELLARAERYETNARADGSEETQERASKDVARRQAELAQIQLQAQKKLADAEAAAAARGFVMTPFTMRQIIEAIEELYNTLPVDDFEEVMAKFNGQDAVRVGKGLALGKIVDGVGQGGTALFDETKEKVLAGDAGESSKQRLAGIYGDWQRFKSAWDTMLVSIVESGLDDLLSSLLKSATAFFAWVETLSPAMKNLLALVVGFGVGFGPMLLALGFIMAKAPMLFAGFTLIAKGLGIVATAAGGLVGLSGLGASFLIGGLAFALIYFREEITAALDWLADMWNGFWKKVGDIEIGGKRIGDSAFAQRLDSAVDGMVLTEMITAYRDWGRADPAEAQAAAAVSGVEPPKFAAGVVGLRGPGSGTSDSIPAWLSAMESVIPAAATRFWGSDFMQGVIDQDIGAVMRPIPIPVGGGTSGLVPLNLYVEGSPAYPAFVPPSVAAQMAADQNLKRQLRKTNAPRSQR